MIRQLAYDLRTWRSLEATGRGGSDDGIDIRGIEVVQLDVAASLELDEDLEAVREVEERVWTFQCKREKSLSPKQVRTVIAESLASFASPPHGFVLAIACDVSKKARDAFREEMVAHGISEFMLWAKGELEDMLFQPKNDRLLFAYFGISLQPRRRSTATALRMLITRRKQLRTLLGGDEERARYVLLRDPTDERYPERGEEGDPPNRWLVCEALHTRGPGCLLVRYREFLAYVSPDATKWDAILSYDSRSIHIFNELNSLNAWDLDDDAHRDHPELDYWREVVPEVDRAYLQERRCVPIERVIAIDPAGDGFFPIPHIFVEFGEHGPFDSRRSRVLIRAGEYGGRIDLEPNDESRIKFFAEAIPAPQDIPSLGLEGVRTAAPGLSEQGTTRLEDLLARLQSRAPHEAGDEIPELDYFAREQARLTAFLEKRDQVILPVLIGVTDHLRRAGQRARVVVRSLPPQAHHHHGSEYVQLRFQLHRPLPHSPDYFASGSLTYTAGRDGSSCIVGVDPSYLEPQSGPARLNGRSVPLEEVAADLVESHVQAVLELIATH